jgi:hypothetical protein
LNVTKKEIDKAITILEGVLGDAPQRDTPQRESVLGDAPQRDTPQRISAINKDKK